METNPIARRSQKYLQPRSGTPVRSDNKYDVVTAAQPSQTNSMAVNDDGTDFSYFSALKFWFEWQVDIHAHRYRCF